MRRAAVLFALGSIGLPMTVASQVNALTDAERSEGWTLLFDGKTTTGWRGYGRTDMPEGWQVVDGALTRVGRAGDIVTTRGYRNFELRLEWKVAPGGNSGIFYRGIESDDPTHHPIFESAPEMQVLDDERHADGDQALTSAGSNYGLYPAPPGVARPTGAWNAVRIVVRGNHVEHWLNDQRIVSYELGSADWKDRVAKSKFAEWPAYGTASEGLIGLQDHGDWVAYRNIKLKELR